MDIPHQKLEHYQHHGLTAQLWQDSATIRQETEDLEFIKSLTDGSLSRQSFNYYLAQDVLYLRSYSRALALISSRSEDIDAAAFWAASAHTAIVVEAQLHRDELGLKDTDVAKEASPECLGYSSFLIATASNAPYPVAAASALPCFWLYADVSLKIFNAANEVPESFAKHPYRAWVENYSNTVFQDEAAIACELINRAAEAATAEQREQMREAFLQSCRYEYLFWRQGTAPQSWV